MIYDRYFQHTKNYFWQWEDAEQVLTIPEGSTIAYREWVAELLEYLTPQGLPPFGSLLLAIVATNPNGVAQLKEIEECFGDDYGLLKQEAFFSNAAFFLQLLTQLPPKYKQGNNRLLLFQTIFENSHNSMSAEKSKLCTTIFKKQSRELYIIDFLKGIFKKDFHVISLLCKRFPTVESIIEKMVSLPNFDENELILEKNDIKEAQTKDFIAELSEQEKTFYVGALIPRIWGGLNIPVHSGLPSQQPLGGISDLTNKGDFDRLLLSEFANDDLLFLSRLANNEALFIQREIPPISQNLQRIILIDVTIKNWGTPKIVAFATMLAIAKHPKTNIECVAYAVGDTYEAIDISNIDGIIDGLQKTNANLHAVNGLSAFFNDFPNDKSREIFIITNPSTLKQTAMFKAMNDYHAQINYWIHTDAEGNIDVYKKQQNSKKHLQHLNLPLEKLWTRNAKINEKTTKKQQVEDGCFPILFPLNRKNKATLFGFDNFIFLVTNQRALLKYHYDNEATGCEMIVNDLPIGNEQFVIGQTSLSEYVLMMCNTNSRKITLLKIETRELIEIDFPHWGKRGKFAFSETENTFYYSCTLGYWKISLDGRKVERCTINPDYSIFNSTKQDISKLIYSYNIFKNTTEIGINKEGNLAFNKKVLILGRSKKSILIQNQYNSTNIIIAKKNNFPKTIFEFSDTSTIEINPNGMLILKSSNPSISTIYIPAILDMDLGVATQEHFAGEIYFQKQDIGQEKMNVEDFYQEYLVAFVENIQKSVITDKISEHTEIRAEYPGGQSELMSFLRNNIRYPVEARRQGIKGRVVVKYIVEKDGSISNVIVVENVHPLLDEEAKRVIQLMPNWKPGIQGKQAVRSYFTLPISFKLD